MGWRDVEVARLPGSDCGQPVRCTSPAWPSVCFSRFSSDSSAVRAALDIINTALIEPLAVLDCYPAASGLGTRNGSSWMDQRGHEQHLAGVGAAEIWTSAAAAREPQQPVAAWLAVRSEMAMPSSSGWASARTT